MELLDTIKLRRSVRSFNSKEVDPKQGDYNGKKRHNNNKRQSINSYRQ